MDAHCIHTLASIGFNVFLHKPPVEETTQQNISSLAPLYPSRLSRLRLFLQVSPQAYPPSQRPIQDFVQGGSDKEMRAKCAQKKLYKPRPLPAKPRLF